MLTILIVAGAVFALCCMLRRKVTGTKARPLLGNVVRLDPFYNHAAAFGLSFPRGRWQVPLTTASLVALLAFAAPLTGFFSRLGAGLAAGGGASNLYERTKRGKVLDYLHFPKLPSRAGRLVYNGADLAIFIGIFLLFVGQLGRKNR